MSTRDDHLLNLQDELLQIKDSQLYTGDGSVDFNGNPVLKNETGNWRACLFLLGNEFCERLAFAGIQINLVTYVTQQMHEGNVSAANIANTWSGTCYLAPLLGAFIADSYWGRYRTISVFSIAYVIGLCAVALSASAPPFLPVDSLDSIRPSATSPQYAILFVGLYLIALGMGGIKPCVPSFGAYQFDSTDTHEQTKKGSFFSWYFFSASFGSLVSSRLVVWIQENVGWGIGYGIPALCMGVGLASFLSGTPFYRFRRQGGSPFTRIWQVIVASVRKCKLDVPQDSSLLYETSDTESPKLEHTNGLRFLDKAAFMTNSEMKRDDFPNPWRLCTITQVEELKILIRIFPIWVPGIVDFAINAQRTTTFMEQGMVVERRVGSFTIPAASLASCAMIASLITVPVYEKTLVPLVKKFRGKEKGISELQRIGIGLCLSILAMVFATLVETRRLKLAKELGLTNENVPIPLSILWQVPQYVISGIAVVFTWVGRLEFMNEQSPGSMRSLGTASVFLSVTLGCYLSSLVLTIVTTITTAGGKPGWVPDNLNKGQLDNYFGIWAWFGSVNLLLYVFSAMRYKQKEIKNVG